MNKKLWLRAKTKAKLKPKLKMKVFWYTCDRELGGMKSFNVHLKASKSNSNLCKIFGKKCA